MIPFYINGVSPNDLELGEILSPAPKKQTNKQTKNNKKKKTTHHHVGYSNLSIQVYKAVNCRYYWQEGIIVCW